jgi:hypothetical protein
MDLQKGTNDSHRMSLLKGRNVITVVNPDRVAIMIGKGDEGCKVPMHDVSQRGVIVALDLINIP